MHSASQSSISAAPTLDDLVIRKGDLEDGELALALHRRVGLQEKQDRIWLLGDLENGAAKRKLVAAGLARYAMQRKGWFDEKAISATTEWFAIQVQQKPKSIGEELSRLKKLGLMERDEMGWRVPIWALRNAIEFLES